MISIARRGILILFPHSGGKEPSNWVSRIPASILQIRLWQPLRSVLLAAAAIGLLASVAPAPLTAATKDELDALRRAFDAQQNEIKRQRDKLNQQERLLDEQRRRLEVLESQASKKRILDNEQAVRSAVFRPPGGLQYPFPPHGDLYVPSQRQGTRQSQAPVGQAPQQRRPEVPAFPERGGVLTPKGTLVVEPSIEYSHSDVNRFTFQGIEIIDTVLIGVIETEQADRDILTAALAARYGITDRLEAEVKVPYVYRKDSITTQVVETPGSSVSRDVDGNNIGDVEGALHYQINRGQEGWPFFVGNVRFKTDTGKGPFDVDRDSGGIETELATGSGFWSVEPSLTILYPSDPAVLFANFGYLFNLPRDIGKMIGGSTVGRVDPGDAFRMAFGIGFGLNEMTSISLGYQHDFINGTDADIDGINSESVDLDIGTMSLGISYQVSPRWGISTTVKVGATEDAPDISMLLRIPIRLQVFD